MSAPLPPHCGGSGALRYASGFHDDNVNPPSAPAASEVLPGTFILVKYAYLQTVRHYVGCVEEEYDEEHFNVRYLRNEVDNVFVYPDREDLDTIHHRVIESVLPFPKLIIPFMGTSLRGGKYVFEGVTFPKTVV